jgi:hypothetical protein
MSNFVFPKDFDENKQRAYVDARGVTRVYNIAPEVAILAFLEPTEGGDPFAERAERARQLSAAGHVIDAQVDVWGWGAVNTNRLRRMYGKTHVPDAMGKLQILVPPAKEE